MWEAKAGTTKNATQKTTANRARNATTFHTILNLNSNMIFRAVYRKMLAGARAKSRHGIDLFTRNAARCCRFKKGPRRMQCGDARSGFFGPRLFLLRGCRSC